MKHRLLIVDDDEEIRTQMKWALSQDYEILLAEDRAKAIEVFKAERPGVTMLDLGLPPSPNDPEEGLAALSAILGLDRTAKVIIVSGQGEKQNAMRAVGAGAYDFLCKPVDLDELKLVLQRCFYVADLEREYLEMQRSLGAETFEGMLGSSPQMQGAFAFIRKVAATNCAGAVARGKRNGKGNGGAWRSIGGACGRTSHLLPSIAVRFRKTCSKASYSGMKRARLPERIYSAKG